MEKQKPIRVLQMISSLYSGGSQAMIMNIYQNIDRDKIQFDFVVDHSEYDFYKQLIEKLGGKIYYLPPFTGLNVKEVKESWDTLFNEHPEYKILHSHSRSHASLYLPIAKKHGVKTIIHSHNTSNGSGFKSLAKNIMQYPLRFQANYFIGCSKKSGEWLFGKSIVNSDRFFILNNAIDIDKYKYNEDIRKEYRKKFNITNGKVFIQVGSFSPQKNHSFTIDLFKKILEKNDNCLLFLPGAGPLKENIENKVKEYNIQKRVFFLGQRDDVSNLLQMADCYLMPSLFEGLSVAAVEAQASGIKCLLSDTVTKDVGITETCEFLPINLDVWYEKIANVNFDRIDTYNDIKKAGFDIKDTTKILSDFYERIIC